MAPGAEWSGPAAPVTADGRRGAGSSDPEPPRRGTGRKIGIGLLAVAAMVGSGVVGGVIADNVRDDGSNSPDRPSTQPIDVSTGGATLPAMDVAAVLDHIAPSIVTISADVGGTSDGLGGTAVGSGVIITADGEILTNAHVVDGASTIHVRLAGESEPRDATLLASDTGNDLALLRIDGSDFPPATFAEPGSVAIGDQVLAIGFALDLDGDPSVTLGIVSALDRTIATGDVYLDGLIQTDAAISSGNSGGPLVNSAGEVVGINTAVARGDLLTAATNIGFAISAKEALPIVEQLRQQADGTPRVEGFLGVGIDDRTDGGQGAVVAQVTPDTPAADAGLVVGDVVIEVDDTPINGTTGLVAAIRDRAPGDAVEIVVLRDGERVTLTATLIERPDPEPDPG